MFLRVAFPAQQFKVIKIGQDLRISDIVRVDIDLMVYDLAGIIESLFQASFTQAADGFLVRCADCLPFCR